MHSGERLALQQLSTLRSLFKYQSGRVIALGRVMLCLVLLLAVAVDRSEPHLEWARTYSLLMAYAAAALIIAAATWRNWWLDARLAIVTHGIDMAVFTAIRLFGKRDDQPFFLVFRSSVACGR